MQIIALSRGRLQANNGLISQRSFCVDTQHCAAAARPLRVAV